MSVQTYFERIAEDFDSYYEKPHGIFQCLTNQFLRKPVITKRFRLSYEALSENPPKTILDIGCGSGVLAIPLSQLGHKLIGIDFSAPMIEMARKRADEKGLNIDFRVADFFHGDFAEVDHTVALGVFEYFKDPSWILRKMIDTTKNEGKIVFDLPELFNIHTPLRIPYLLWRKQRVYFYSPWALQKLLKPHKKELTKMNVFHYGAGYLVVLKKA